MMGNKEICGNPHARTKIMTVISMMSPQSWSNSKENNEISSVFV